MSHEQISHSTPLVEQVDSIPAIESIDIQQPEITRSAGSLILKQTIRLELAPEEPITPIEATAPAQKDYESQVNQPGVDVPTNPIEAGLEADMPELDHDYIRWASQREEDSNPVTTLPRHSTIDNPPSEEEVHQLLNHQFSEIGFMLDSYLDQYEEPDEAARATWFELKRVVAESKGISDTNIKYEILWLLRRQAQDFANQHKVDGDWTFKDIVV